MKSWLTVAESAIYSGVSRDTIYTACERRELRHARVWNEVFLTEWERTQHSF